MFAIYIFLNETYEVKKIYFLTNYRILFILIYFKNYLLNMIQDLIGGFKYSKNLLCIKKYIHTYTYKHTYYYIIFKLYISLICWTWRRFFIPKRNLHRRLALLCSLNFSHGLTFLGLGIEFSIGSGQIDNPFSSNFYRIFCLCCLFIYTQKIL